MLNTFSHYFPNAALILVSFMLGMRHGLDLDHLAIIDAMTRKLPLNHRLLRYVGFLFSLGHGVVVILFCILINVFVKGVTLPVWLNNAMLLLSIIFLIIFGLINISSLFKLKKISTIQIFLAKKIFSKLNFLKIENPLNIMAIGAVFAVSFDTVSQIALFSLNITHFLGVLFPIILGITFMIGMMVTDGINGYVVAFLLRQSIKISSNLSRILTFSIGLFSSLLGVIEIIHLI